MTKFSEAVTQIFNESKAAPRDYQIRLACSTLNYLLEKGAKSVMLESPIGSGKTVTGLVIVKYLEKYHNAHFGWVAMRRNLLKQAMEENEQKEINANITPISMYEKNLPTDIDCLLVDEGQHDSTSSMAHIHNTINPKMVIALSGTPFRTDRVKLCFEAFVRDFGIYNLIKAGYLSKYIHYTIPDWNVNTVVDFYLNDQERWGKSIMFFHRLDQCYWAKTLLENAGIAVDVVSGNSNVEKQIEDFKEDKLKVVINCMKLTEGFDCPSIKTVFIKPSCKIMTIQMGGRALRPLKEIPYKQIVQPKSSPWPFIKTAIPHIQYLWQENEWRSLTPNMEKIETAHRNSILTRAQIDVKIPKFIEDRKHKQKRRFRRGGRF